MEQLLQHLLNGLVLGGTYALLGIGLVAGATWLPHGESYRLAAALDGLPPRVSLADSRGNTAALVAGNTFSDEPGIYLPGEFGVRIEDLTRIDKNGVELQSRASKEPLVL